MFRPVPEFIAAVIPQTRSSRLHSATRAFPNTVVYCGGAAGSAAAAGSFFGAALRSTMEAGFAACHFSMPSSPPSSAGANPLPFTVLMCTTTGRFAFRAFPIDSRSAATSCPSTTPT